MCHWPHEHGCTVTRVSQKANYSRFLLLSLSLPFFASLYFLPHIAHRLYATAALAAAAIVVQKVPNLCVGSVALSVLTQR